MAELGFSSRTVLTFQTRDFALTQLCSIFKFILFGFQGLVALANLVNIGDLLTTILLFRETLKPALSIFGFRVAAFHCDPTTVFPRQEAPSVHYPLRLVPSLKKLN